MFLQASSHTLLPAVIVCVVCALCLDLVNSQAPGDGNDYCLGLSSHPVYDDYEHPLMDSKDYIQLISSGGVWQTLDKDGNNLARGKTEWKEHRGSSCTRVPEVCGYATGPQNNWMITQHISRQVLVDSVNVTLPVIQLKFYLSIDPCPSSASSCVEALSLYVWETSTQNAMSAADTDNYHFIANLSPETQEQTIHFSSVQHSGFYLGIRDNGTCARVHHVLVYYTTCEAATVELVSVNKTVFNSSSAVQGECVADSVAIHETGPSLVCSVRGEWSVDRGCQCTTQHYMDNTVQKCLDCPANSEATQAGLTKCPCVQNYYRAGGEGPSTNCTQSPSAPTSVSVSDVTNTSATLSWEPPEHWGGRDSSEINYTVTYTASSPHIPDEKITGVNLTQTTVTELVPFLTYTFSVTAENAVSSQDSNVIARTTSTTATTLEGVAAQVTGIRIVEGVKIEWPEPDPPHGTILYYNIRIRQSGEEEADLILAYNSTHVSHDVWNNEWKITADNFIIQVQAVTRIGPGEFSGEFTVAIVASTTISVRNRGVSTLLVSILVTIVVLMVLIIATILTLYGMSRRHRQNDHPPPSPFSKDCASDIEAYACVMLSPSSVNPPSLIAQRSPRRPMKEHNTSDGNQEGVLNNVQERGPAYAVLEGPTPTKQYSLNPTPTPNTYSTLGVASIDCGSEKYAFQGNNSTIALEDPQNSLLITNRENKAMTPQKPPSESVASSDAYWNEGLGPLQNTPSDHTCQTDSSASVLTPGADSQPAFTATLDMSDKAAGGEPTEWHSTQH